LEFFKKLKKFLGFSDPSSLYKLIDRKLREINISDWLKEDKSKLLEKILVEVEKYDKYPKEKIKKLILIRIKYMAKYFNKSRNLKEIEMSVFCSYLIYSKIDVSNNAILIMSKINATGNFLGYSTDWPTFIKFLHFASKHNLIEVEHKEPLLKKYLILLANKKDFKNAFKAAKDAFGHEITYFEKVKNDPKLIEAISYIEESQVVEEAQAEEFKPEYIQEGQSEPQDIKEDQDIEEKNDEKLNEELVKLLNNAEAGQSNEKDLLKKIEDFKDINLPNDNGNTLLMVASRHCYLKLTKLLIQNSEIKINEINKDGCTPLMLGVINDKLEIVQILIGPDGIKAGIDLNKKNKNGKTALMLAASKNEMRIVNVLIGPFGIAAGININEVDKEFNTVLMLAVIENNIKMVIILTGPKGKAAGINMNQKDKNGKTALMLAAVENKITIVSILIGLDSQNAGIDINEKDQTGKTALELAKDLGKKEIVQILEKGNTDGYTPLTYAVEINDEKMLKKLIKACDKDAKIYLNTKDGKGNTPLTNAVIGNKLGIVRILAGQSTMAAGIDMNLKDGKGMTPLINAVILNKLEIVKELVINSGTHFLKERGTLHNVDINKADKDGKTPLIHAVIDDKMPIVKVFIGPDGLKAKIDINKADKDGKTPLIHAVIDDKIPIVKVLTGPDGLKAKIDINKEDKDGKTPLIHAVIDDKMPIVKVLTGPDGLKAEIDMNKANKDGNTVLMLIVIYDKKEMFDELIGPSGKNLMININKRNNEENTVLMLGVIHSRLKMVEALVKLKEINVNEKNKNNKTALDLAKKNNRTEIVAIIEKFIDNNKELITNNEKISIKDKENELTNILENYNVGTDEKWLEEKLKYLIDSGIKNINSKNSKGYTPFMLSVMFKHKTIIDLLLGSYGEKAGINLDEQSNTTSRCTAFLYSIHRNIASGDTEIMEMLIDSKKVDVNKVDGKGDPHITYAVDNSKILEKLILKIKPNLDQVFGSNKDTVLIVTARYANALESLKVLIKYGATLDLKNEIGETALFYATLYSNLAAADELIKAGADKDIQDIYGKTPLIVAAARNDIELLNKLIESGANKDIQNNNGKTALIVAAEKNDVEVLKKLIEAGADKNIKDHSGKTASDYTNIREEQNRKNLNELLNGYEKLEERNIKIKIEDLIDEGGNIDQRGRENRTLLTLAAEKNHIEITELLLNNGADVNLTGKTNYTALMIAASFGYKRIVKILTKSPGIELNKVNPHQATALVIAVELGQNEIVKILMKTPGINPNVLCGAKFNETPLIRAVILGQKEIVKILIRKYENADKLDLNYICPNGTALDLAYKVNTADRKEIIGLLEQKGAKTKAQLLAKAKKEKTK